MRFSIYRHCRTGTVIFDRDLPSDHHEHSAQFDCDAVYEVDDGPIRRGDGTQLNVSPWTFMRAEPDSKGQLPYGGRTVLRSFDGVELRAVEIIGAALGDYVTGEKYSIKKIWSAPDQRPDAE